MKIRRLEIQGFKSFADRTVFDFDEGISAIVGPNGCGKSNVVDAIKWVLGDMSPRSLRGKKMEDVIFAGSRHRRPLNLSEVTLTLDNADGLLATERAEVSITRRLHRTGESEYLVCGEPARLKDIRELFFDTGLGVDGNAIMEQGQIDALLAASPEDRRGIFEEAAGISRYKQRRKEAEQRLAKTQENLERLLDVVELEDKRLRSLKVQAGKARRYAEIREELAKKRVLRAVLRYRAVSTDRREVAEAMDAVLGREQAAADELAALETSARRGEADRQAARERAYALEGRIAKAASDARAARDRAAFAERSKADLLERIAASAAEADEARRRAEAVRAEMARLLAEAEEAEGLAGGHRARLAEAERELRSLDDEAARLRDAHDGVKREALRALGRISDTRNRETERRSELRQAGDRLERVRAQAAEREVERERIEGTAKELEVLAARLETEGAEKLRALADAEDLRARRRQEVEALRLRHGTASESRATKAARLDVLRRLAAAREGVDPGARLVLEALQDGTGLPPGLREGTLGILADLVGATPGGAAALDRLLGPAAGAVVVRRREDALQWVQWLKARGESARARFLALDLVREGVPDLPPDVGRSTCPRTWRACCAPRPRARCSSPTSPRRSPRGPSARRTR
jgi:chromosome segregation protein